MSRKNNQQTRRNLHNYEVQRELELEAKRKAKLEKRKTKEATKMDVSKGGVAKKKKRGILVKKGAVVKGIRIKSAKSRDRVLAMLKKSSEDKME